MRPVAETPAPRAVFRADASPRIGSGHVMRCLALADALARNGWRTGFAVDGGTAATIPLMAASGHEVLALSRDAEVGDMAERWPDGCDLLVVDHYRKGADFEGACRPWARRVMVIDDLADRPHDADLLLDMTPDRRAAEYRSLAGENRRFLLGPGHALLRPEFRRARARALARRNMEGGVARILVGLGGFDADNVTSLVLEAIERSGLDAETDVVLQPAAPHLAGIRAQAARIARTARVHAPAADLAALMAGADLAIGAGGGTAWERCCLALPTLLIVTADNQKENAARLAAAGAAECLGAAHDLDAEKIADALRALAGDAAARRSMARSAALLCDGLGVGRVAAAVDDSATAGDGQKVSLRPVTMDDEDLILTWQRAPGTRQYARNPAIPTAREHHEWLTRRLADPNGVFNMVLHGGRPAGVVRLDRIGEDECFEVSINIAPESQGMGLGKAALGLVRLLVPEAELRAEVLPGNAASQALFRGAGYQNAPGGFVSPPTLERNPSA